MVAIVIAIGRRCSLCGERKPRDAFYLDTTVCLEHERPGLAPAVPRDIARSRRARAQRAVTVSAKRSTKRELLRLRAEDDYPEGVERPKTRGDCADVPRPCPFVSCAHHLYLDTTERGGLKLNFPDLEPDEIPATCALDVADEGPVTLERAGELLNLTRERVRQTEVIATKKMQLALSRATVLELVSEDPYVDAGNRSFADSGFAFPCRVDVEAPVRAPASKSNDERAVEVAFNAIAERALPTFANIADVAELSPEPRTRGERMTRVRSAALALARRGDLPLYRRGGWRRWYAGRALESGVQLVAGAVEAVEAER